MIVTLSGNRTVIAVFGNVTNDDPAIIVTTKLYANYPNPFNPSTIIKYSMKEPGYVSIHICDVKGRRIKNIVDGRKLSGNYIEIWNGSDDSGKPVGSGVYYLYMKADKYQSIRKMVLMK